MLTFSSICDEYIKAVGCEKKEFATDEEAKKFASDMTFDNKDYPVVYLKVIQQVRRHTRSSMFLVRKLIWIVFAAWG